MKMQFYLGMGLGVAAGMLCVSNDPPHLDSNSTIRMMPKIPIPPERLGPPPPCEP